MTTSSGALQFATGTRGVGTLPGKCGEDETLAVWGHVIRVPKWCGIARRKQRADLAQFKLSARRVHAGNVDMRHAARETIDGVFLIRGLVFQVPPRSTEYPTSLGPGQVVAFEFKLAIYENVFHTL